MSDINLVPAMKFLLQLSFFLTASLFLAPLANAQPAGPQPAFTQPVIIQGTAHVIDPVTLVLDDKRIRLWGVEPIDVSGPVFSLNSRTALANAVGSQPVECEIKQRLAEGAFAQCVNDSDLDLSLFMIQQGYVSVDREAVYKTVFEEAYIQAEMDAQDSGLGVWGSAESEQESGSVLEGSLLLTFAFFLFLFIVGTFTFLSIFIMRGFRNVIDAQNDNLEMMSRERKLRDRERGVVATMVDSELKANKSKIEAYIVVYEEILNGLRNPDKEPKYKTSGDIVQKQPALARSVFDRNTDKLDVLGRQLASDLVHFYARIKSTPEYLNLEPEMELSEAIHIVEDAVSKAKKLDTLAEELLESFEKSGVLSDIPQE